MLKEQSTFSRGLYSSEKMMYYPTSVSEMEKLGGMFDFNQDEVAVLEPCIGLGEAVTTFVKKGQNPHVKIFGVELNTKMYEELKERSSVDFLIKSDFLKIRCSNRAFSLVFCNPPYGDSGEKVRLETKFLKSITRYLKRDGLLVWVIPIGLLKDKVHNRLLSQNFKMLDIYRFCDSEFKKFRQVAVILKMKMTEQFDNNLENKLLSLHKDDIPLIPEEADAKYQVQESFSDRVNVFQGTNFDEEAAMKELIYSPAPEIFRKMTRFESFSVSDKNPPLMPNSSQIFIATSVGRTEIKKMESGFIQRGVVKVKVTEEVDVSGKKLIERQSSTSIVTVIEPTGKITRLGGDSNESKD